MSPAVDRGQGSQQGSHSRSLRIYILCLRTSSPVFAFISPRLSHLSWDFQLQSWSATHLRFSQWISSQCRPIGGMDSRFGTKLGGEEEIVLRACLGISRLGSYLISGSPHRASAIRAWRSQSTSGISVSHVHICFLDQIFTFLLLLLLVRHAFWQWWWECVDVFWLHRWRFEHLLRLNWIQCLDCQSNWLIACCEIRCHNLYVRLWRQHRIDV